MACAADDSLVRNGDFENGDSNWEAVHKDKGTFSIEENGGIDGTQFLRLKPSDSAYPALYAMQQLIKPPIEGGKYKFRARVRLSEDYASRMPMVEVNFKPPRSDKVQFIHVEPPKDAEPGKWTTLEADIDLPEDVPHLYVHLFVFGAMGHVDFDGVEMVAAPVAKPKK
ncbi:MAG: carbohydrate binding domain-containing protein [Verrucomicrobia bacterium]|nr:carbohydrate binding domain-containing protein [Verrucomicrobiota bacterium]